MSVFRPVFALLLMLPAAALAAPVSFNRDIRPIMSNTCFHCHGPDASHRKAKLRLDLPDQALLPGKSGALPIVPGKPEESEIIKRIFQTDEDELMPPPEEHKPLTPEQKETFRRWVAEGAVYEPHWAYTPLTRPEAPAVHDTAWGKNEIDRFIRARQEAENLPPSAGADRPTLLRRLSLDLIGLPPTPEEVAAFQQDDSPGAWEKQVDRLLASPHFGERMAVAWLDLVRFSDTVGYHGDQNQRIFPYRDYVIQAYNTNKPFDQFTREQLAGDLLPHPSEEQLIATGFNRLNMMTREGGAQPEEYLAKYGADRTRVVATTWLGSTFGCAECHDHKFDPISTKDFYSLQSFFADVQQWGVYAEYEYTPNPELRGVNNDWPFPPEVEVSNPWLMDRSARSTADLRIFIAGAAARRAADPAATAAFEQWRTAGLEYLAAHPDGWASPVPDISPPPAKSPADDKATPPEAGNAEIAADGTITLPTGKPSDVTLTLRPGAGNLAALRLELLPSADPKRFNGMVSLSAAVRRAGAEKPETVAFHFADADRKSPHYSNGAALEGILSGWKLTDLPGETAATGVWILPSPLSFGPDDALTVTLTNFPFSRARLSCSPFAPPDPARPAEWMATLAASLNDPGGSHLPQVNEAWLTSSGADPEALAEYRSQDRERRETHGGRTMTMVTRAVAPLPVRVLPRGNWQDLSGPEVPPATPHFLPGPQAAPGQRLTRLDLANWITSPENPLTARAVMNRLWRQFFGTALSAVVDDLGAQGEPPSHPELLDWMAAEFRDSGWDTKHLIRLIVTSATYRQNADQRPEIRELDPANRLLTAQNPRRLGAEFVRDNALSIAGLLDTGIGGPSVKPYQPTGYYVNIQFPNRDYLADGEDGQWRRGVYMHWQRAFLHPMLANFDAPMRDECAATRTVSNTPQQALTLLNDPTFAEAARVFAQRLLGPGGQDDAARLTNGWRLALARAPQPAELESLLTFLNSQREGFRKTPEEAAKVAANGIAPVPPGLDPVELAAWTSTARVILNLHETITRY